MADCVLQGIVRFHPEYQTCVYRFAGNVPFNVHGICSDITSLIFCISNLSLLSFLTYPGYKPINCIDHIEKSALGFFDIFYKVYNCIDF